MPSANHALALATTLISAHSGSTDGAIGPYVAMQQVRRFPSAAFIKTIGNGLASSPKRACSTTRAAWSPWLCFAYRTLQREP